MVSEAGAPVRVEPQKRRRGECGRDAQPLVLFGRLREQANKTPGYGVGAGAQAKAGVGRLDEAGRRGRRGVSLPRLSMIF